MSAERSAERRLSKRIRRASPSADAWENDSSANGPPTNELPVNDSPAINLTPIAEPVSDKANMSGNLSLIARMEDQIKQMKKKRRERIDEMFEKHEKDFDKLRNEHEKDFDDFDKLRNEYRTALICEICKNSCEDFRQCKNCMTKRLHELERRKVSQTVSAL